MSSGEGEEGGGEGGRGGGGDSPFSNGEVLTNGEEVEMEVDGEEGRREEVDGEGGRGEEVMEEPIDVDSNPVDIEKILSFGRDLQALYTQLSSGRPSDTLKTLLQVCVSLHCGLCCIWFRARGDFHFVGHCLATEY